MPIRCSRLHDLLACRMPHTISLIGACMVPTGADRLSRLLVLTGVCLALSAPAAWADTGQEHFALPNSGLQVQVQEIIWDHDQTTGRFRFIAPELASALPDEQQLAEDFMMLCNDFARPTQRAIQPDWGLMVLSLGSEPTVFGEYDPAVLQVFEGFEIDAGGCSWETF
ncbi:MAG: hypothetical protein JJU19_09730 [Pararhodobacter sp.]|nr:hypothetical protein [Pararhodobacter sp.]